MVVIACGGLPGLGDIARIRAARVQMFGADTATAEQPLGLADQRAGAWKWWTRARAVLEAGELPVRAKGLLVRSPSRRCFPTSLRDLPRSPWLSPHARVYPNRFPSRSAPGNAGIALEPSVTVVPTLKLSDFEGLAALCRDESIEMVVVGPEQPLVDSVADFLTSRGVAVFGPTAAAARLEGSKAYMKGVCDKYGVPTAKSKSFTDAKAAAAFAEELGAPLVVKASGLAAGKGVSVCATLDEARQAIEDMMVRDA